MKTSPAGIALIQSFESCRLKAYKDGGGVWTCGWGSTGQDVKEGAEWTQEYADQRFERDLVIAERHVNQLVTAPLTQQEFDALVSWTYNLGGGALRRSTLLTVLNNGEYEKVPAEIRRWDKDNGKTVAGLTRRRKAEAEMFES